MITQWHVDNAKTILEESRDRMVGSLKELGVEAYDYTYTVKPEERSAYNLGVVRALDLGISVLDSMSKVTAPEPRTLRQDVMSLTQDLRNGLASTLEDLAWKLKTFNEED